jgi:hypothetical protein
MDDKQINTEVKNAEVIQPTAEDFSKQYQELCDELGYRIVVTPVYTARDDGTFSLVLQYQVGKLPEDKKV